MRQHVAINWGLSSYFGWGVYGINLALAWAADPQVAPVSLVPISRDDIAIDPLRMATLDLFMHETRLFIEQRRRHAGPVRFDVPVLVSMGNDLDIHVKGVVGTPTIGVTFFEHTGLSEEALERGRSLPVIVTGSTWNERILREHGLTNVVTILQGVDTTLFHPGRRLGLMADRFKVFSGGKLEFRKGQDIVMEAFARFARRHPDAVLVTAWHSPWEEFGRTLDISGRAASLTYDGDGKIDAKAWAAANGVASHQFLDLGAVPNGFMPPILREMDAALFTNRGEGGTNLVAMECMACGVPTILSANTGHLDLIDGDCCLALTRQNAIVGPGAGVGATAGWGDSDSDEVVEALERLYADRDEAGRTGALGAAKLASLTWARTAGALKDVVRQ